MISARTTVTGLRLVPKSSQRLISLINGKCDGGHIICICSTRGRVHWFPHEEAQCLPGFFQPVKGARVCPICRIINWPTSVPELSRSPTAVTFIVVVKTGNRINALACRHRQNRTCSLQRSAYPAVACGSRLVMEFVSDFAGTAGNGVSQRHDGLINDDDFSGNVGQAIRVGDLVFKGILPRLSPAAVSGW